MILPKQICEEWVELADKVSFCLKQAASRFRVGNYEGGAAAVAEAQHNNDRLLDEMQALAKIERPVGGDHGCVQQLTV